MDGWSIKLTAACVLTLSGAAVGRALGRAKHRRVEQLSALLESIMNLRDDMLGRMLPVRTALEKSESEAFRIIAGFMDGPEGPFRAYQNASERLSGHNGPMNCLEKEELALIEHLFQRLGVTGTAGQQVLMEETLERLKRIREDARTYAQGQARLYGSLGLMTGLAFAICLL